MKYRTLNHIYAWFFGYFWLPCPSCGQMFGGHESDGNSIPSKKDPHIGDLICPDCSSKNKLPNKELWEYL